MTKLGTYIIRLLFMSFLLFTAMIEALIKKIFVIAILKFIFWESNIKVIFEMHFLWEQFWIITLGKCLKWLLIHVCRLMWLLLFAFLRLLKYSTQVNQLWYFDLIKYQSQIVNNWLQSSLVCEQRYMLRILAIHREILCFPR